MNELKIYGVKEEESQFSYDFSNLDINKLKKDGFDLFDEIRKEFDLKGEYNNLLLTKKEKNNRIYLILIHGIIFYFSLFFFLNNYILINYFLALIIFQIPILIYNLHTHKPVKFGLKHVLDLKLLELILIINKEFDSKKLKNKFFSLSQSTILGYDTTSYNSNYIFEKFKRSIRDYYEKLYSQKNIEKNIIEKKTMLIYFLNNEEKFNLINKIHILKKKESNLARFVSYINIKKLKEEFPYLISPFISITLLTLIFDLLGLVNYIILLFPTTPGFYYLSKYLSKFINKNS